MNGPTTISRICRASLLCAVLTSAAIAQQNRTLYYDTIENGRLTGGRVTLDPSHPAWRAMGLDGAAAGPRTPWNSTTILDNGPAANRADFVLLGDGYTTAELPVYAQHAAAVLPGFFGQEPWNAYRPYFNVHRVNVISNESGVDEPDLGILRDTALDMRYNCGGIPRLLCVNITKALDAAASAPAADFIIALANSNRYGGAGLADVKLLTAAGGNSSTIEIVLHEFGHALANLADEYDYADGSRYTGPEPAEINATIRTTAQMAASQTKWYRWLDLPNVDVFQGCSYYQFGIFRPTANSKMRTLGLPYEEVNVEELLLWLYRYVRPIDAAVPDPQAGPWPREMIFSVTPLRPVDHALSVQWFVDEQPIEGVTSSSFSPVGLSLAAGLHRLRVTVTDNTPRVRNEAARQTWMTDSRVWLFTAGAARPDINGDAESTYADVAAFVQVLLGADLDPAHVAASDRNGDGAANGGDIQTFVWQFMGL